MDNTIETINTNIDALTVWIPVHLKMRAYSDASFEFTTSIDELGQIVLTPLSKDVEFTDVAIDATIDPNTVTIEKEVMTTSEGTLSVKETSILITANMLAESENHDAIAIVDEIGQIIISPAAKENSFVTASFEESLNLVTEEMQLIEYFGYKLVNNGDGWDVTTPEGDLLEEGIATLSEAKTLILQTELRHLTEEIEKPEESSEETTSQEEPSVEPDVTAEVITEEQTSEADMLNIVTRFMQGDIALFSDTGTPSESYVYLPQLSSKGYSYYYDEESDAVVSYPSAL